MLARAGVKALVLMPIAIVLGLPILALTLGLSTIVTLALPLPGAAQGALILVFGLGGGLVLEGYVLRALYRRFRGPVDRFLAWGEP